MNDKMKSKIIIYDNYKDLLSKDIYEPIILSIMNQSKKIFPEDYKIIKNQSHGESDYISTTGKLYDSKILFYEEQCESLAINEDQLSSFIEAIQKETEDIYNAIISKSIEEVKECIFYKEMVKEINKANYGENIILFLPYAFTLELEDNINSYLSSDIFSYIFNVLVKEIDILQDNEIFMIYPNYENKIIVKNLNTKEIEFITSNLINKYITFDINS